MIHTEISFHDDVEYNIATTSFFLFQAWILQKLPGLLLCYFIHPLLPYFNERLDKLRNNCLEILLCRF